MDNVRLSTYLRIISDSKGSYRADQNVVANFKLLNWLRLEAGFRYGERPQNLNAYYHYKLELQSKYFLNKWRCLARISDNVFNYPSPAYRKTNELFAIEGRLLLSHSLAVYAGAGFVWSTLQNNVPDARPTMTGTHDNYPIFRLSLRYLFRNKGFIGAAFGSYDVFNPYGINTPFTQIDGEYDLSEKVSFFAYTRYQYNYNLLRPYNYFLGAGLVFHFSKQ